MAPEERPPLLHSNSQITTCVASWCPPSLSKPVSAGRLRTRSVPAESHPISRQMCFWETFSEHYLVLQVTFKRPRRNIPSAIRQTPVKLLLLLGSTLPVTMCLAISQNYTQVQVQRTLVFYLAAHQRDESHCLISEQHR